MANLEVWDYFLEENLAHGPAYDIELVTKETQQQASEMALDEDLTEASGRITMNLCYDNATLRMPHAFSSYLQVSLRTAPSVNHLQILATAECKN